MIAVAVSSLLLVGVLGYGDEEPSPAIVATRESGAASAESQENCGTHALLMALFVLGRDASLPEVEAMIGSTEQSTSLLELQDAAEQFGLASVAVRWRPGEMPRIPLPSIIPIQGGGNAESMHYLVLLPGGRPGFWELLDYPNTSMLVSSANLSKLWDGTALHLAKDEEELAPIRARLRTTLTKWQIALLGTAFIGIAGACAFLVLVRRKNRLALGGGNS